jgi:hypothetical protein
MPQARCGRDHACPGAQVLRWGGGGGGGGWEGNETTQNGRRSRRKQKDTADYSGHTHGTKRGRERMKSAVPLETGGLMLRHPDVIIVTIIIIIVINHHQSASLSLSLFLSAISSGDQGRLRRIGGCSCRGTAEREGDLACKSWWWPSPRWD